MPSRRPSIGHPEQLVKARASRWRRADGAAGQHQVGTLHTDAADLGQSFGIQADQPLHHPQHMRSLVPVAVHPGAGAVARQLEGNGGQGRDRA